MSNFTVMASLPVSYNPDGQFANPDGTYTRDRLQQVSILSCHGCSENMVVIEDKYIGGKLGGSEGAFSGAIEWRGIRWWPAPGMRAGDPDIPTSVADCHRRGHSLSGGTLLKFCGEVKVGEQLLASANVKIEPAEKSVIC